MDLLKDTDNYRKKEKLWTTAVFNSVQAWLRNEKKLEEKRIVEKWEELSQKII